MSAGPIPSKRPFGFPVPAEALAYLVDPVRGHEFARPFKDASGNVVCWNGALAVRIRSFVPDDVELSPKPWEAVENSLHWPAVGAPEDKGRWRPLDDAAGFIWKFPPRSPWIELRGGEITGNKLTSVRVGAATVVPLSLLQLAARLPRCRVNIDNAPDGHLQFLWNGGEAVIAPIEELSPPRFSILSPRSDLWTGAHVFTR